MDEHLLTEILAAHADRLVAKTDLAENYLTMFPEGRASLAPLLNLAAQVKKAMQPATPDPVFRQELRQQLVTAARRQYAIAPYTPGPREHAEQWVTQTGERLKVAVPDSPLSRPPLLLALLGSVLSLAGVIAFILRSRTVQKPQPIS